MACLANRNAILRQTLMDPNCMMTWRPLGTCNVNEWRTTKKKKLFAC